MKHKLILFLALSALSFSVRSPALADPTISVHYSYYNVEAHTVAEISNALTKATPIVQKGKKYRGYAKNSYKWTIKTIEHAEQCAVSKALVDLRITYILPRLIDLKSHSPKFRKTWDGYFYSLYLHEKGHGDIARKTSVLLEKRLSAVTAKNCALLKEEITFISNRIIAKSQIKHVLYDEETNHGETQGADLRLHIK